MDEVDTSNGPALLPCVVFLHKHRRHGGIDARTFEILYKMIQYISAIGWETHRMVENDRCASDVSSKISKYADCLLEGCYVFSNHIRAKKEWTFDALKTLPPLDGSTGDELRRRMVAWDRKLRTLHEPTGNDLKLFGLITEHYRGHAYRRMLRLRTLTNQSCLDQAVERCIVVDHALDEICELAELADGLNRYLDSKYDLAIIYLSQIDAAQRQIPGSAEEFLVNPTIDPTLAPKPEVPPVSGLTACQSHVGLSRSFMAVESELVQRRHQRAATFAGSDRTTRGASMALSQEALRRAATDDPRIFTGSFSQLEDDIHRLQLHKVNTPESQADTADSDTSVKVHDFAAAAIDFDKASKTDATASQCDLERIPSSPALGLFDIRDDDVSALDVCIDQMPLLRQRIVSYPQRSPAKRGKRENTL